MFFAMFLFMRRQMDFQKYQLHLRWHKSHYSPRKPLFSERPPLLQTPTSYVHSTTGWLLKASTITHTTARKRNTKAKRSPSWRDSKEKSELARPRDLERETHLFGSQVISFGWTVSFLQAVHLQIVMAATSCRCIKSEDSLVFHFDSVFAFADFSFLRP